MIIPGERKRRTHDHQLPSVKGWVGGMWGEVGVSHTLPEDRKV